MKHPLSLLALGVALAFAAKTASAQATFHGGEAGTQHNTTLQGTNATPAPGAPATPSVKKPLTGMLARDEKGKKPATAFTTADPQIFLVWKNETAIKGDAARVVWVAEDAKGLAKNKKISEGSMNYPSDGSFTSNFFLTAPKTGMPVGKYRAELYDGAKLSRTLKFTVS